ncbi:mobilization protein (plasmid) [Aliivibrio salmonicida]|uniref:MbeD family mobilization/exclusion protein n=1 Tax=Aliivibrio salmonicida TaxID=40269 RepID=UPI00094DC37A|nr:MULTISPECIES: MbeD family mobilization/exclusion protein [Gammaproteobacteria]AZL83555.1 mobilization protein [Aliivibrio salmonicida]
MTELEKQLLNAFEILQEQHEKQHQDFQSAYKRLEEMFSITSKENKMLNEQVNHLSDQVSNLSKQLVRRK